MCTEPLLHIGHSFVTYLPLEARKCVLGVDHCVSDPDIGVGPAPPPTARRNLPCRLAPLAWPLPSPPALRPRKVVWGDLPELLRFGDQPPSPRWDPDAEKRLSELASPQPPLPTLPPSPPSPTTSPTPVSPPPRPHVTSTPYLVALEAVEDALMCTAVPPPSPPTTPQVRTQGPPHPPQTHRSRALQCQNIAAHPGESRGWGSVFRGRGAEPPSDVPVCGSAAQEKPLAGVAGGHAN